MDGVRGRAMQEPGQIEKDRGLGYVHVYSVERLDD